MDALTFWLAVLTLLGSALIGGIFFIFSNTIMKSLAQRPAAEGMAVMQAINRVIINPGFLAVFMGTAVLSLVLAVRVVLGDFGGGGSWLVIGAAAYFVGTFGVTIVGNVPLNNGLEKADPESEEGQAVWAGYLRRWTRLNTLRTVLAFVAAGCALGGLLVG
jgi:uncharacterized membrane protein